MKRRADRILQMVKDKNNEEENNLYEPQDISLRSNSENIVNNNTDTTSPMKRTRPDTSELKEHTLDDKENEPWMTSTGNVEELNVFTAQPMQQTSSSEVHAAGELEKVIDEKASTNAELTFNLRRSKSRSSSTSSSSSSTSSSSSSSSSSRSSSSSSSSRSSVTPTPSTSKQQLAPTPNNTNNQQFYPTPNTSKQQLTPAPNTSEQQETLAPSTNELQSTATPRPSKQKSTVKPNYKISPINTDESDVDLSDFDPTFELDTQQEISSPSQSSSCSTKDDATMPKKKTRKRLRNPSKWKQNIIKKLRNSGQAYVSLSKSKKQVSARRVKEACNCRLKCSEKISENDRKDLFNNYWKLNNLELQRSFIRSCMMEIKPKYKYTNAEKPRLPNNALYFTLNGNRTRVCKQFFINTLDITDRQLRTVKNKTNSQGFVEQDKRGKHNNRKQVDSSLIQDIKDHINSIPKIESHYLRANADKEYISESKTIKDICDDFNKKQKENNRPESSYWLFINTFNKEFNIGFYQPKKDRCETCLSYELAPVTTKLELENNYENHLKEKDLCRQEKKTDRENIDSTHVCAIFDLQSVMLCPSPSYFYYSSKINCLDFTITELNATESEDNKAYGNVFCYFWDETQGNRGANEIGSCLFDYLRNLSSMHPNEQLHVIFYSDNCTGQNKNKMIATLYSFAVLYFSNILSITHKYLIKGHTHNEADNVHSLIEKEIKKNEKGGPIYTPPQYVTVIKSARKSGQPFTVKELNYDFFVNLKKLQEQWAYNFNEDSEKKTVLWNNIKVLKFLKEEPFVFYYKTSYSQTEFKSINMRNKRKKMLNADEIMMEKLYMQPLDLKENKKKDLKDLVRKNLIPSYYASYYDSL